MTVPGSPRSRFAELVKLHVQGNAYLGRDEERRLLEEGVTRYGLTLDEASGVLRASAEQEETALDRELARSASLLLKTLADPRGRVARHDFAKAVAFWRARAGSQVSHADAERRVKRLMDEAQLTAKPSGMLVPSRRWFRAIEA